MEDYADSYEPLIARKTSSSEIEIIDDFKYNLLKDANFATGYTQFQQKNFVQLPTGLVKPRVISKMKFKFTPAKPVEEKDEESQLLSEQSPPQNLIDMESEPEIKSSSGSSSSSLSSSQSSSSDNEPV